MTLDMGCVQGSLMHILCFLQASVVSQFSLAAASNMGCGWGQEARRCRKQDGSFCVQSFTLANFPPGAWDQGTRNKDTQKGRTKWLLARNLCIWNM